MDNYGSDLMEETVRFIEYCQERAISGEISHTMYNSLVAIKIDFINSLLKDPTLHFANDLIEKSMHVMQCHAKIADACGECAGK